MFTFRRSGLLRIFAVLLAVMLVISGCDTTPSQSEPGSPGANSGGGTPADDARRTIPYSEMVYERPDTEAITLALEQQIEAAKSAESYDALLDAVTEVIALSEEVSTAYSLAELMKYHDATDTFAEEEYLFLSDASVDLDLLIDDFNRAILDGPFSEDYRKEVGDYVFEDIKNQLLLNSPEVSDLKKEQNQLVSDYNKTLATLTVTYGGKTFTMEDIYAVGSYHLYLTLVDMYYSDNAAQFADMYARFIEIDKEIAATLGFESAADMHYLNYSRDYSPADGLAICGYVKEYFAPLASKIDAYSYYVDIPDQKTSVNLLGTALKDADAEISTAWDFMIKNELYDIDPLPNKQSGAAFTTFLAKYDTPFIYLYWEDDFFSFSTLSHEFGHFYENWLHYADDIVFTLDLKETFSQGLELLMHNYYPDFFENPEDAQMCSLAQIFEVFPFQCLIEEFQHRAYALETVDADTLAKLYYDLMVEYGYGDYVDGSGVDHSWFRITHMFDAPFYTISYVSSAGAALQLWEQMQDEGFDTALKTYKALASTDQNQPFAQVLESVGLKPTNEEQVYADIAEFYKEKFIQNGAAGAGQKAA